MPDVRFALLQLLRAPTDDEHLAQFRAELERATDGFTLAEARNLAKDDPAAAGATALVLGCLIVGGAESGEVVDAAKAAAQRAPRTATGSEVALLAGSVLWAQSGDPALAEPYFRRVRRDEPAHPEVLTFYRELFGGDSNATQLVQVLVQARRASSDLQVRMQLAHEVAELAEQRLHSPDRAIEMWRSVIREDGPDAQAIDALTRLYRESGKWRALVDLLGEQVERLGDAPDTGQARIDTLREIANLYRDELRLDTMTLATLQRILEIDPHHEATLDALGDTYANAGRWGDLLAVYSRRIDAAADAGELDRQIELLRRSSEIWMGRLGNPQRALAPLHRVLELSPKDPVARELLAQIHEQRRDFRALIALRREELLDKTGDDALALRIELARLAEDKLGDRREAIDAWNDVLAHHGDVDTAFAALARLYEREGRWASAAEILHRKLTYCTADEATRLLVHLGNLYTDRLQVRDDATAVWRELLRLQPGHDKAIRRLRDAYVAERDWDALTDLYEGQGRLAAVVEVLHSAADRIGDVADRVALYRRVAGLCQERLGQPERAVKALERTLAIQPDNLEVAGELVPIYREQSNWARLLSTYEILLRASDDVEAKLELIGAMQEVAEHKLASPTLTLHWAAEAFELRPSDPGLRERLYSAAERADGWDELVGIFERRLAAARVDPPEQLLLLQTLAVVARDRLSKPDDAQRFFRRILTIDSANVPALDALQDIYLATKRWDDLADVYRRRLAVAEDAERLNVLRSLASLQEEELGDLEQAVATHREVLEEQPGDAVALEAMCRIHRNRGQWRELADALTVKLERVASDRARVPVLFERASICATRLQLPEQAVEGFLSVLELDPVHRDAVQALEAIQAAVPSMGVPVMRGLLPYYRRIDDKEREAAAIEVLVAAQADETTKFEYYEQLAALYEKMPDRRDDAFRIRMRLFAADPARWEGRQVLTRLGGALGRLDDVALAYDGVLAAMAEEARSAGQEGHTLPRERVGLRRDVWLEYAALLQGALGRPLAAEKAYADVLELEETHQGAYEALEALLSQRNAYDDLAALYRRRVDVTFNPREQKQLLSRIIEISRTVLDDRPRALRTAEELHDLQPDDVPTVELLAHMYGEGRDLEDRRKLEEILGRLAELTPDTARARELRVERAALRMQHLDDPYGAVDLLGQVLGEDAGDAAARGLLEALLANPEAQLQACALLEPIYIRAGDHAGRIRILDVRRSHAQQASSPDEAVGYLLEIVRIHEYELDDPNAAFTAAREAYLMDPTRFDTRQEVERLALKLGRFVELAQVWQAALQQARAEDPTLRIDLVTRLARLQDRHLRDPEAARASYQALLALDPPDVSLAKEAVEGSCRLHLEAGDHLALVDAKRRLLQFSDALVDQVQIRLEVAELQEQLRDRVGAALSYAQVVDMQPANPVALVALERLFSEEREWARLGDVLEHRVGVTLDSRARGGLWRRLGELYRDRLESPDRAIDAFASVVELKVGREDTAAALAALVDLHERSERWPDVEENLRRLITIAETDEERVELLTKTAIVVGRRLARGSDALTLLKRVLDLAPTDSRARSEARRYLDDDETRDRAIRILTPLFEAEQNWPALLELEELQARQQPSGRRRLQALLRVAKTQQERIGDLDRAFAVLCEALTEAADQPELEEILDRVEELGAADHRASMLFDAYESTVDHILDAALQKRVLVHQGDVAFTRLGRLEHARETYERVLEMSPDDAGAADALEDIYDRQGDHEGLAALLVARADRASTPDERDRFLVRAAEIERVLLHAPETAIELYERLSAALFETPEVQDVLEPLYQDCERWPQLAAHLSRKLGRTSGKDAVDTHLRLGRLYGGRLGDPEAGIRHFSAALRLDPEHATATEELDRYLEDPSMRARVAEMLEPVFAAVADWKRLIQIQEIRLADAPNDDARMRILLRIAQIEEEQLEDLERALASYERLFREQPQTRYVRDQLSRLCGVLGDTRRFAQLLTVYVMDERGDDDSDEMLAIVQEAADLWSGVLREPGRAVPLLHRLRAAQPDNVATFSALENALTQSEGWRELADLYGREADVAYDEGRQLELLRRLATLAQEMLEDEDEAARAYRRMLELRPDYELARNRLEDVFVRTDRHAELLELLRENMTRTEAVDARSRIAIRVAELQETQLDDPDAAIDTLESVLTEMPDDPAAVVVLERIAQNHRDLRPRALGALHPIYERAGNVRRLVEIAEWELGRTEDPAQRHELYRQIAGLHGGAPDTAEAGFRALCRALAEPGPEDALDALDVEVARVAQLLEIPATLADALVAAAEGPLLADDRDRRLYLMVWSARLQRDLGDPEQAAAGLEAALALAPEHATALELMDSVLVRLEHHEALAAVVRRRIDIVEDDAERVDLLRRLGRLLEEVLVRPAEAEQAWKDLLVLDPGDREALRRLSAVYEQSGSTGELIDVIERQIEGSSDPAERRELRMQLAALLREAAKDRAAEIEVLRALLTESSEDEDALAALGRALQAEERYDEAVDVLLERSMIAASDERRATLLLEAARMQASKLANVADALERYEQVLVLQPGHALAIADLVELAKTLDHFEAAGDLVLAPLRETGRFTELADVLEARAGFASERDDRALALAELASLRLERLDDPQGALACYAKLLDVVDDGRLQAVLEQGGRLAVELGQGAAHLDSLAIRAQDDSNPPGERIRTAIYAAELAEEVLGEPRIALDIVLSLLDAGLADLDVCARVERLGVACGRHEAVEQALREAARAALDPTTQADALVRLGHIQLEQGDHVGALESLRDAFDLNGAPGALQGMLELLRLSDDDPGLALLDALEAAHTARGDKSGQAQVLEYRLRAGGDRVRLLEQLASLREDGGGTPEQALRAWGELLRLDPESGYALERLLGVAKPSVELLREAAAMMLAAIEGARAEGRTPVGLGIRVAAVLLGDLRQPAAALSVLAWVLEADPDHADGLALTVQAARGSGDVAVLHDVLGRSATLQADPQAAAALWAEAAVVAETALGDVEAAVDDLEQMLALDEGDARAWLKLLGLLASRGEHERLGAALARRIAITPIPAERRELRYRLANLQVDKLDRSDDAIATYRDMLADDPSDIEATVELEALLRGLERWVDVRDVLEAKLDHAEDSARIVVLEELAQLAETRLDDPVDAIERYQQVLLEIPGYPAADAALERLLRAEERWVDLSELLQARGDRLRTDGDAGGYRRAMSSLATLLAGPLQHPERAQEILDELLEHDPAFVPAILGLAAVYEARGEEGAMRLKLQQALDLEPGGAVGAAVHLRLAELAGGDAQKRREHYERALALDPGNPEVLDKLIELCRAAERWDQLVYLLELQVARVDDPDERRELVLKRVDIMLEFQRDAEGALRVLAPVYQDVQDDLDVNRRIADALFAAERFEEAAGMYGWLVDVGRRNRRGKSLAHHLTRLARISLRAEHQNGAKDRLLEAYRMDTTNVETLMTLGTLHEREAEWKEALKIYRTMLLQNADRSGLLRRGDIYINLARAHLALEERPKARAMLRRGLEEDTEHPRLGDELAALEE